MLCPMGSRTSSLRSTPNTSNSVVTRHAFSRSSTTTLSLHQSRIQASPLQSRFLPLPISLLSKFSCSNTPNNRIDHTRTRFIRSGMEKLAVLVLGSAIFAGSLRWRTAFAISEVRGVVLEEKVETPDGGGGDERRGKTSGRGHGDFEVLKMAFYGKMREGKTADALKHVEKLIDVEPDEVEWRLLQALSYELMGELGKAKRLFEDILEKRPFLIRALHGLALVMHKNREGLAVFEMLDKALGEARRQQRVPEERNIQILVAQMHVVQGDFEEGLKRFQELVHENPRDFRPFLCQGIIYSLLDKKKEAEEQFEIYWSLVPEEFPQRGFLDDIVLAARTEAHEHLQKEFNSEFSYKK